jgi:hypothetical protein
MLKLSFKDIITSRNQILLSIVFWTVLTPALLQVSTAIYYVAITFGVYILLIIPFLMDSRNATEILFVSLPVRKEKIILARYLSSIALAVFLFSWATIIGFIIDKYVPQINVEFIEAISTGGVFIIFCIAVIIIAVIIPVIIRFDLYITFFTGIFITAIFLISSIFILSSLVNINYGTIISENTDTIFPVYIFTSRELLLYIGKLFGAINYYICIPLMVTALCLLIFGSYRISLKIYRKKEF